MALDFEKDILDLETEIEKIRAQGSSRKTELSRLKSLQGKRNEAVKSVYKNLTPWQAVQVARHENRPLIGDYIEHVFSEFVELHGDRCFGDDRGIIGGFAQLGNHRVMLIGHQKGRTVEENVACNFGMGSPDGYRKALRLMKLAEKYQLPVIGLIDTPGAYPGLEAETRGQAEAIARNLTEMAVLETPIIVAITGEGGSGGALGIGAGDVNLMLTYSVYSVISPEGCASILWRDGEKAPEAAQALKLTAASLKKLGLIDTVIPEPAGGAHRYREQAMQNVKTELLEQIKKIKKVSRKRLVERRMDKYARIGRYK